MPPSDDRATAPTRVFSTRTMGTDGKRCRSRSTDVKTREAVLIFRGSCTIFDWFTNFHFLLCDANRAYDNEHHRAEEGPELDGKSPHTSLRAAMWAFFSNRSRTSPRTIAASLRAPINTGGWSTPINRELKKVGATGGMGCCRA